MIAREWKRRVFHQELTLIPIIIEIFFITWYLIHRNASMGEFPVRLLAQAGLVSFPASLIFSFVNYRCPSCNGYLGFYFKLRPCPKCGALCPKCLTKLD